MPTALFLKWDGVTAEQYDQVRAIADWEGDHPEGGMFHAAAFAEDGMRIFDLWETAEAFHAFFEARVMPAVQQVGLPGEPVVELIPVHATFTPRFAPA